VFLQGRIVVGVGILEEIIRQAEVVKFFNSGLQKFDDLQQCLAVDVGGIFG